MKQHYTNEKTGISYTLQGDYYLPNLALPIEKETKPIGVWGQRHLRYLKEYRRVTYLNLLTSGRLNTYLADIDKQAEELFFQLVEQMKQAQGITTPKGRKRLRMGAENEQYTGVCEGDCKY